MATDLELAYTGLTEKQERYNNLFNYYEGRHPLEYNASKLREIFGELDATFNENWCAVVINTVLDRIGVARVDLGGQQADDVTALWRAAQLDLDSHDTHLCALVTGEAFVVCGQAEDGTPEAYFNDSRLVHMVYDDARPRTPRFAAKWWEETPEVAVAGVSKTITRLTLYYPDRLEHYVAKSKRAEISGASAFTPDPEQPAELNPYGEIPVYHFKRERRAIVSELVDIVPLQAQLNKVLSDMMIAAEFGAFRQRYVISQYAGGNRKLRNAPNEIWDIPASDGEGQPTSVGEFDATDLGNYLAAIDRSANVIATIAGIPKTLLFGNGDVPSGAALRALEAPLVKKAERYAARWEPVWRQVLRWLLRVAGRGDVDASAIDLVWEEPATGDPESAAATAETWVKAGMPLKTVLRRQGWSEAEIARLDEDREEDDARNATLSEAYMAAAESNANRQAAQAPEDADNG